MEELNRRARIARSREKCNIERFLRVPGSGVIDFDERS
jgi:hypothetical protein